MTIIKRLVTAWLKLRPFKNQLGRVFQQVSSRLVMTTNTGLGRGAEGPHYPNEGLNRVFQQTAKVLTDVPVLTTA